MYERVSKDDLEIALLFFTSLVEDTRGIIIQCQENTDIPYIKHNIRKTLGTPDRFVGNSMFYDRRPISILSISEYEVDHDRYDSDILFFVEVNQE